MCTLAFFPADCRLDILHIEEEGDSVTLQVQTTASSAICPDCGQLSQQVHSRYTRTLKDLAFTTKSVEVVVLCRRFFCANPACLRRTFAEALTGLTRSHARSTTRLDDAHRHIGFANGGEAGARLAALLHIPISAAGMLRRLKNTNLTEDTTSPQVVGVDDWALRKGQRYGTRDRKEVESGSCNGESLCSGGFVSSTRRSSVDAKCGSLRRLLAKTLRGRLLQCRTIDERDSRKGIFRIVLFGAATPGPVAS